VTPNEPLCTTRPWSPGRHPGSNRHHLVKHLTVAPVVLLLLVLLLWYLLFSNAAAGPATG
jgi:hypothetical protein